MEVRGHSPYLYPPKADIRSSSLMRRALLTTIAVLCAVFAALVICGALYGASRGASAIFYGGASVLMSAAAVLVLFYVWLSRRCPFWDYPPKMPPGAKMEIATLNGLNDYYSQVPTGRKSDFPMGPNLVMTLPKNTTGGSTRRGTLDSDCSAPNTPRYTKRKSLRRAKNLPPLASMETLTPSLVSSCYGSIDSVV
ncbi:hypothetical protein JTE90_000898 [Oedothorax gibbosus]|uniref:Uncharacterized protein n=1 Tax=Oedothorax gibbosus TaxID=931172 RepID=A0AAV6VUN9_9ARAC|nr:hypothetical protein JTE90_000898 [Oedothorax gibbosus]